MRAKKADVWISGDSDVILLAKRNESWAHVIDPGNPLDRRPNTLAVRYGDPEWKSFIDFYGRFLTINGEVERLFKYPHGKARRGVTLRCCSIETCPQVS